MNTKTMTIHEALADLKVLDSKITNRLVNSKFVTANKHSNAKIDGKPVNEFVANGESDFQSILDLLQYRKAVRNALSKSNAITVVTIAGKEYTISEAIEMKKYGMGLYRELGQCLARQLENAQHKCTVENSTIDSKADTYVTGLIGSKDKAEIDKASDIREKYVESNTYEIVSVKDIVSRTAEILESADAFFAEVDAKISISNALTTITVEW